VNSFDALWSRLEAMLTSVKSSASVFNQYLDCNPAVDRPEAARIRRENLHDYLRSAANIGCVLVVGEAAGPWGTRFSGVPFTGERQLLDSSFPYRGRQSSLSSPLIKLERTPPFISSSSATFWNVMLIYSHRILAWDMFPLHPHKIANALSVRTPTSKEIGQFAQSIELLMSYAQPKKVLAIGMKSYGQLQGMDLKSIYIRHPANGGNIKFRDGVGKEMKIE
jgi:uracil-DNA glycosylase